MANRPPNTTTDMIMRDPGGAYRVYNLGQNKVLNGETQPLWPANTFGDQTIWDFAGSFDAANSSAVGGAVQWDFNQSLLDFFLRDKTTGDFALYVVDPTTNTLLTGFLLGAAGLDWKTVGFGYFNNLSGQADLMLAQASGGTTTYKIYDTVNGQFETTKQIAAIGSDFKPLGIGEYVDGKTVEALFVGRYPDATTFGPANTMLAYAITNNQIVSTSTLGPTPLDFIGFGHFSSQAALGMMMRDSGTGQIRIYDVTRNLDTGKYSVSSPDTNIVLQAGQVGLDVKPVGLTPMNGSLNETDLVMRDPQGQLWVYDIQNDKLAASFPAPFLSSNQVGNLKDSTQAFGPDLTSVTSTAASQLGQAMASFGGDTGAAAGLNAAPLGADTSQPQSFLTTPQHA